MDRKDGPIRGQENTMVVDLPGIYSMSPYTSEEIVSRHYFLDDRPRGIINIVDATNIERNLYLTMQLIELNIPMVLALNMMDEVTANGGSVDVNQLEEMCIRDSQKGLVYLEVLYNKNPHHINLRSLSVSGCPHIWDHGNISYYI